jgi:transposase
LSGRETAITTIAHAEPIRVTVGVDTHGDVQVACAIDQLGRHLATTRVATTPTGYRALLGWARSLGEVEAGALRAPAATGLGWPGCWTARVRSWWRSTGPTAKPDVGGASPIRSTPRPPLGRCWLGQATAVPKTGDQVEMVRCLGVARATAIKARPQAANALRALVVTAPAERREELRDLPTGRLASTAARLRPGPILTAMAATKLALRLLGQRYQALDAELAAVDAELDRLTAQAAPGLRQRFGVGAEIAGALLVAAGENPGRLRSEAAFAMLCGASPVQASSGKTVRHRLNRVAIVRPTRRCTGLWWSACVDISQPVTTWPDGPVKGCRSGRSSGASLDEYPGHDPRGVGL